MASKHRTSTLNAPSAPGTRDPAVSSQTRREEAAFNLARLEEEDSDLAQVEVDEVLRLVRHVRAEVAAHDAVPGRVVLFVELLLDESGDVLLDVVLLEGLGSAVDGILLHVLGHVSILDHGLAVSHGGSTGLVELSLLW